MSNHTAPPVYLALIKASSDVLEYEGDPYKALVTAGSEESVALCVQSALIPVENVDAYMTKMTILHNILISQYRETVSTKPKPKEMH